ncbi:zinc-dependent alcohol dehydrogenase family protein [Pantoea sp. USHLN256]|uniref:zinc-dependent alcohol dehydrogenase family protein n=1 Tax=Pantoea sp. USHLN256 TaxID=3081293 RepID=UPI003FA749A4
MSSTPKPNSDSLPITTGNLALVYRQFGDPARVLTLESAPLPPRAAGLLRVAMQFAPINASDLIPVTGAYRHRVIPPQVAGYEGVGTVIEAPAAFTSLLGQRVLPLRSTGTWQCYIDCDPHMAVPVPCDIDSALAARAYINPLAALLMLQQWPPTAKRVLITAGGSACALLLAQWARQWGAAAITVVHRAPQHASRLQALGITSLRETQREAIAAVAQQCDVVFDAAGGEIGQLIWHALPAEAQFVAYGVLSGKPVRVNAPRPALHWFHVRHTLEGLAQQDWQQLFCTLWPLLRTSHCGEVAIFPLEQWREALHCYHQSGRDRKPLLQLL